MVNSIQPIRFLCVCDGGNVRSQALAFVLHDRLGHEAIAIGRLRVSIDTMATMCNWADCIVIMQPHMQESIPSQYHSKLLCCDVGDDRFGVYVHPELLAMVTTGADWILSRITRTGDDE
jgi:predicted protein tyrosine phosphatase